MQYHHLTLDERERIAKMKTEGISANKIAEALGRSCSTITREFRRNGSQKDYWPSQAQTQADQRRLQSKSPWRMTSPTLSRYVKKQLQQRHSPEQITGRLRLDFPDNTEMRVSHTCLYQWVAAQKQQGRSWHTYLRQAHRKRRKRYGASESRGRIVGRVGIEKRPAAVDRKVRFGDWEGDTVEGAKGTGYLVSHVERKCYYTVLGLMPDKRSETLNRITRRSFRRHKGVPLETITVDNGKEFAGHAQLSRQLGVDIYFSQPYHAWERGINENTNGLLRQFFPKGMDFRNLTTRQIRHVERLLNNRPRKALGYRTPLEVMQKIPDVALQN